MLADHQEKLSPLENALIPHDSEALYLSYPLPFLETSENIASSFEDREIREKKEALERILQNLDDPMPISAETAYTPPLLKENTCKSYIPSIPTTPVLSDKRKAKNKLHNIVSKLQKQNDFVKTVHILLIAKEYATLEKLFEQEKALLTETVVIDTLKPIVWAQNKEALFCQAASNGHLAIVQFLFTYGQEISLFFKDMAFKKAKEKGHVKIMMFLLIHPYGQEISMNHQACGLCFAAYKGSTAMVNFLLDRHGEVISERFKMMALKNAEEKKFFEVMLLLIMHPQGAISTLHYKEWALCYAAFKGYVRIAGSLLDQAGENISEQHKKVAISNAIFSKKPELLSLLLSHPSKPKITAHYIGPMLYAATETASLELVTYILRYTKEVLSVHEKWPALCYAAQNGHVSMLRLLMAHLSHPERAAIPTEHLQALLITIKKNKYPVIESIFIEGFEKTLFENAHRKRPLAAKDALSPSKEEPATKMHCTRIKK